MILVSLGESFRYMTLELGETYLKLWERIMEDESTIKTKSKHNIRHILLSTTVTVLVRQVLKQDRERKGTKPAAATPISQRHFTNLHHNYN